jgi:hypothetical protein
MISLEEEARISRMTIEEVSYERRFHASIMDFIGNSIFFVGGSLVGCIAAGVAQYYSSEDLSATIAGSGIALLSTIVVGKSFYELGKFTLAGLRNMRSQGNEIMKSYLEKEYPDAHSLDSVFVDDLGNRKN